MLFKLILGKEDREELLDAYKVLPAFNEVKEGLAQANVAGYRLFAFSNGEKESVETLLSNAGILNYFNGVVSVDDLKSFKPNPWVYSHFIRKSGSVLADTWLISSNPFDVIGAFFWDACRLDQTLSLYTIRPLVH